MKPIKKEQKGEQSNHQMIKQVHHNQSLNDQCYRLLMEQILRDLQQYPNAYYINQQGEIVMRMLEEVQQRFPNGNQVEEQVGPGRGGNNVSENVKKAIRSTLKRFLTRQLFQEFQEKYIQKYNLKSQKQNYVIFFLFLHKLLIEQKISRQKLETIREDIIEKIKKYINNSEFRLQQDNQREDFHRKNIRQFQKFLEINIDFTQKRRFSQIKQQLKSLYLRKVSVYKQAIRRVISIINQFQVLKDLFEDINSDDDSDSKNVDSPSVQKQMKVIEEMVQQQQSQ